MVFLFHLASDYDGCADQTDSDAQSDAHQTDSDAHSQVPHAVHQAVINRLAQASRRPDAPASREKEDAHPCDGSRENTSTAGGIAE